MRGALAVFCVGVPERLFVDFGAERETVVFAGVERLRLGAAVSGTLVSAVGGGANNEWQTSYSAVSQSLVSSPGAPLRARKISYARVVMRVCNSAADSGAESGSVGAGTGTPAASLGFFVVRVAIPSSPDHCSLLQ